MVRTTSVPVRDFEVKGEPLLNQKLDCVGIGHDAEDLEACEYVAAVEWVKTFPLFEAKTFAGVFANQNIVCKLRDEATIEFLRGIFPIDEESPASEVIAQAAGR